jgi:hypothetical protein
MADKPDAATREPPRRDWRGLARAAGTHGNERLIAAAGLVLLVLLLLETLTTLSLRSYLSVHIFLGLLVLPPVALKLGATGWRFFRYYAGSKPYRLLGPPRLLLRLLAPLLVASTLSLFGSGVALIVVGHGGGLLQSMHAVSFGVWGVVMIVHVLAYLVRTLRLGSADWRRQADLVVAGARSRRAAVGGALLAGVVLAVATYPAQHAFRTRQRHRHPPTDQAGAVRDVACVLPVSEPVGGGGVGVSAAAIDTVLTVVPDADCTTNEAAADAASAGSVSRNQPSFAAASSSTVPLESTTSTFAALSGACPKTVAAPVASTSNCALMPPASDPPIVTARPT